MSDDFDLILNSKPKRKTKTIMANEQIHNILPSKLTVVTEKDSPFFDLRSTWKVDAGLKNSIANNGIIHPILAVKADKQLIVVDGKQRVNAARELESEGQSVFVPVIVREYDEGLVNSIRVISNNLRFENDFLTNVSEAKRLKEVHNLSFEQIGGLFNVTHQTIRNWLVIDEMPKEVKTAVQKGMVTPTAASQLAKGNKAEDGSYNKDAIVTSLKTLMSEASASGEKKVKVASVNKKTSGNEKPSMAELKILAAELDTPSEFAVLLRYIVGELDLKTAKSVARGALDWLHAVKIDKEAKKKAKANNSAAKKEAKKEAKKKATEITTEDLNDLFG